MQFKKDTITVLLESPAQYPITEGTSLSQAKEYSGAGVPHVEDFQIRTGIFTYNFSEMPQNDFQLLFNFFNDVAQGMLHEFQLTDDYNVTRTGRFVDSELNFEQNFHKLWYGNFRFEVIN